MPHKPKHKKPRSFLEGVESYFENDPVQQALRLPSAVLELNRETKRQLESAAKPALSPAQLKARRDPEEQARMDDMSRRFRERRRTVPPVGPPVPYVEPTAEPTAEPPWPTSPPMHRPSAPRDTPVGDLSRPWWDESGKPPRTPDDPFVASSPYGGGGQLERDPTSFAPPPEEFEPAWDKRERDIAARAILRRQLKEAKARGPMGP
jgi:hypothetical protein